MRLAVEVEQVAATRVVRNTEVLGHSHALQETHYLSTNFTRTLSSERERPRMLCYPLIFLHSRIEPFDFLPETKSDKERNGNEVHLVKLWDILTGRRFVETPQLIPLMILTKSRYLNKDANGFGINQSQNGLKAARRQVGKEGQEQRHRNK